MKLRNILFAGVAVAGLASCSDYLDVESPSVFEYDYVYSTTYDMNLALNGLYARLLSPYSGLLVSNLQLNSDIDFSTYTSDTRGTNNARRFDVTDESTDANNLWRQGYIVIEHCNQFIKGVEASQLYKDGDEETLQMLGEAMCIRAIMYHEMVWYFGDIPYSLKPTNETGIKFPVVDRNVILDDMIADLKEIAPKMKPTSAIAEGVERIGQDLAYSLVARLALTAGGYTLKPDKNDPKSYGKMERMNSDYLSYYRIAEEYAKKVIDMGGHSLTKDYVDVFVDECNYTVNNTDDPIFEIPFAKDNSGNIGYYHGLKFNSNNSQTDFAWGATNGGVKVHSIAPYLFDPEDIRRQYLFGTWNYSYQGVPSFENNVYTIYNNKWSKLWSQSPLGNTSAGGTGINYPYMRYADVLLMFAEAANEVHNGPTGEAQEALRQVRARAFRYSENQAEKVDGYIAKAADKESFLKAVLDERKYEFAGENMRWRDLVRNNIYGQELYYTFLRHCCIADNRLYAPTYAEELAIHDGLDPDFYGNNIMLTPYWRVLNNVDETNDALKIKCFPNRQLQYIDVFRLWESYTVNDVDKTMFDNNTEMYTKHRTDDGTVGNEVCYSLSGYIYRDRDSEIDYLVYGDRDERSFTTTPEVFPPVRYILPYPRAAIRDGAGAYVNYYGYGY
ncbi:MAG: RagB/SusD family nutrient uptake outer membrane protein [Duncaniella sp.]|nr:RagB/SusD family nutrient uptake outer membrane protein [Duncaniella sp.]MDE7355299.1 RagB/SusD family nutrient uptake outer membrane protein [Rikenellaceae bacterium]